MNTHNNQAQGKQEDPWASLEATSKQSSNFSPAITFVLLLAGAVIAVVSWYFYSDKTKIAPAPQTQAQVQPAQQQPSYGWQQPQSQSPLEQASNAVRVAQNAAQQQQTSVGQQPQVASPQNQVVVGSSGLTLCTGPKGGAFEQVSANINNLGLELNLLPTTGAGDNLTFLQNGKCQYALINSDDYQVRLNAGNDPRVKNTRTIVALFEGVVHMLSTDQGIVKFSQAEGKRVGVTGGAVATFELITKKTGMTFDTVAYNSTTDLCRALSEGKVDMIVMVGAKPQPWLLNCNPQGLHLVEFDKFDKFADLMTREVKDKSGKVQTVGFLGKRPVGKGDYPNLSAGAIQLTTRTVLATTKDAEEDPKVGVMTKKIFKEVGNNLSELRRSGHVSWQSVSTMNDPGGIPWANIR